MKTKYFTKPLLQEAAHNAEKWNLNSKLDPDAVNRLPDSGKFPVAMTIHHRHRQGEPAEAHMRAMVVMDAQGGRAFVDMPLDFWDRLPVATVPNNAPKKRK
jgi:hypothetical protein